MYAVIRLCCLFLLCVSFAACGTDSTNGETGCPAPCPGEGEVCIDGTCVVPDDAGGDDGRPDAAPTDTSDDDTNEPDAAEDTDAGEDSSPDVRPDADDAGADASDDVQADVAPDTTPDAGEDTAVPDATGTDSGPDTTARATVARILEPADGSTAEYATPIEFIAEVTDTVFDHTGVTVTWSSDLDGTLYTGIPGPDDVSMISVSDLSVGAHTVTLDVEAPDGNTATDSVRVGVCGWNDVASFDTALPPDDWAIIGDAYRDERGWLEMTGNTRDQGGAIANVARPIAAGDVRIRFRVATGQCDAIGPCSVSTPGADGFAVSIFDVRTEEDLRGVIGAAARGGGLGYGIAGGWGTWDGGAVDAFHIEFDTWHNVFNGSNEFHTDPTDQNHIAITLNGNPGEHVLWTEFPELEDNEWHDIDVTVRSEQVIIAVDGVVLVDEEVDGLRFKGGYLVFTGTTGFYTNYHRFDQLQILEDCRFD